ncbi:MAG TPA: hypothetical protein VIN08_12480 [Ohtaekwangia sp.]|uniref:hypothetical protein n=1 Tax=Ohtaekwangia sp. TaxID=2066019 RepID=UPI002F92F949
MDEHYSQPLSVPRAYIDILNQIFEIEKKVALLREDNSLIRNVNRLKALAATDLLQGKDAALQVGLIYHNPLGERYDDTRTDCEASITGTATENLYIAEVIKPIIFYTYTERGQTIKALVQKAVVIVQSKQNS